MNMTIAILLHAWTESLALGISFAKFKLPKKHAYGLMMMFCSACSLGVCLGWVIANSNE